MPVMARAGTWFYILDEHENKVHWTADLQNFTRADIFLSLIHI